MSNIKNIYDEFPETVVKYEIISEIEASREMYQELFLSVEKPNDESPKVITITIGVASLTN